MDKYVVFKKEDFDRWLSSQDITPVLESYALEDATVIRRQDVFSSVALYAYAAAVLAAKWNIMKQKGGYSHREIDRLEDLRMYFMEQAQSAAASANTGRSKVPD